MKTIDERLENAAHEVQRAVTQVPVRPAERAVRGHRVARAIQVMAAMALVAAAIGGTAWLMSGDGGGDVAAGQSNEVASGVGGFPTLTLDLDEIDANLRLVHASDETTLDESSAHLVVYGDPSMAASDLRRIWVSFYPDGMDMFRADAFADEPFWEAIPVPTGRAYLDEGPTASMILWEESPGGTVVQLLEMGLGSADLVEALKSVDLEGEEIAAAGLPEGFADLYSGPQGPAEGERVVAMIWAAEPASGPESEVTAEISLWIHEGDPATAERDLFGFPSFVDTVEATEVRGSEAIRLDGSSLTVFTWMETSGHVARLLIQGSLNPDAVVNALVEVDQDAWFEIFESVELYEDTGSTGTTVAPPEG